MNIPVCTKSEYVIIIGNALLSFVWRVSPSGMEGSRLTLWLPISESIAYVSLSCNYNILFSLNSPVTLLLFYPPLPFPTFSVSKQLIGSGRSKMYWQYHMLLILYCQQYNLSFISPLRYYKGSEEK